LFLVFRRRIARGHLELSSESVEAGRRAKKFVPRLLLAIGVGIGVVACLAVGNLLWRHPDKLLELISLFPEGDAYDGMVNSLHPGMSEMDVFKALGQPYKKFYTGRSTSLFYRKDDTSTALEIKTDGTIKGWVVLAPKNDCRDIAMRIDFGPGFVCYAVVKQQFYN
jgi:hypothetical protein